MNFIKQDFNDVVRENTGFVTSIVRKFVKNPEIVKDLTQEIFIRAYQNYDYYVETGKIKAWLSVIANNKLKNYYKTENYRNERIEFINFDDYMPSKDESPENIVEQNDFIERIIKIINTLPEKQRDAVFYSVIHNYSENEIAKIKNISVGSVKSAKHYGLEKVKKLIIENNLIKRKVNNMSKLNKKEAYALLYQYAKNQISDENKIAVEEYMETDEESTNIMEALKILHGKLTYARDDEMTHYNIAFGLKCNHYVVYSNVSSIEDSKEICEKYNAYLEANDGNTPASEKWFDFGFGGPVPIAQYDNEGNKLELEIYQCNDENDRHTRAYVKKMKKIFYPVHWNCSVYYSETNSTHDGYKKLDIAPNLYQAKIVNYFGMDLKSALYLALPENAVNIRMKRGSGPLECGKYKFIYDDRYVMADEAIFAECTFNM